MTSTKRFSIPGYPGYTVKTSPFRVISDHYGYALSERQPSDRRGYPFYRIRDAKGKERKVSKLTIAALAFHGQCPKGYLPHAVNDAFTPNTVLYFPRVEVLYLRRSKFSMYEALTVIDWYFQDGLTQLEITRRMNTMRRQFKSRGSANIQEQDVWYVINRSPYSPYQKATS